MTQSEIIQWYDLDQDEKNSVLQRVAVALDAGELPSIQDSVLLDQSILIFHEDEYPDADRAGYRLRSVRKSNVKLPKLGEKELFEQSLSVGSHLVGRKLPEKTTRKDFARRLSAYLAGEISAAKLLGNRRPQKGTWQLERYMGIAAQQARERVLRHPAALKRRKLPRTLSTHKNEGDLFQLLADLACGVEISDIVNTYVLEDEAVNVLQMLQSEIFEEVRAARMTAFDQHMIKNANSWEACYYQWLVDRKKSAE